MSEFDNEQHPFEEEAERAARERKEKVAGFRLNIDPDLMDAPVNDMPPKLTPPPARRPKKTESAIHTVPSSVNRNTTAPSWENEEKPAAKSTEEVHAIAAAIAAKMEEENDIGTWERSTENEPEDSLDETFTDSSDESEESLGELSEDSSNESSEDLSEESAPDESVETVTDEPEQPAVDPNAPVRILDEEDEIEDDFFDPNAPVHIDEEEEEPRKRLSLTGVIFYLACVLAVSCVLAFIAVLGALDMVGLNKSEREVDVSIPRGATTKQVAEVLHDNGLVSHPLLFRLFSKFTHADGQYQSGVFTLASNAGYQGIITDLQSIGERDTVDVTIPEMYNVLEIAQLLEESEVCTAQEFLTELEEGDYSDYDFIAAIPDVGAGTDHPYRIYRLEGYLFPDTYTFYKQCSPEAVIVKFFDNFDTRVDTKLKTGIKAMGMTLDEAVTLASIVQREADNTVDMAKIARVFHNRLADSANFPHLQSDVTTEYVENFQPGAGEDNPSFRAYSTYICDGLPTGPICNPGLAALRAVAYPNDDADIVNCYYFATDTSVDPTVTYYSETFDEHMAICYQHDIGVHAG